MTRTEKLMLCVGGICVTAMILVAAYAALKLILKGTSHD